MATQAGPAVAGASPDWKTLLYDTARYKLIDVERNTDDANIPDQVDVRTGNSAAQSKDALGGVFSSPASWVLPGVAVVAFLGFAWWLSSR